MVVWPLTISPSRPIRSPGFTLTILPGCTLLASTSCHVPSACWTIAVSGVRFIREPIAFLALSSDLASISSAMVNNTITIAASGHCPRTKAPVTAILISALIFKLPLRIEIQPFL